MTITARLSRSIRHVLGNEAADDLLSWMTVVEANRSELRELMGLHGGNVESRFDAVDARFDTVDKRFDAVDARIDRVDSNLAEIRETLGRFETSITGLEIRMERRFADLLKWSFVFWVGAVGAVAALAGVFRN